MGRATAVAVTKDGDLIDHAVHDGVNDFGVDGAAAVGRYVVFVVHVDIVALFVERDAQHEGAVIGVDGDGGRLPLAAEGEDDAVKGVESQGVEGDGGGDGLEDQVGGAVGCNGPFDPDGHHAGGERKCRGLVIREGDLGAGRFI